MAASVAPLSWAADFSSEPYLLRLFLGLDRASNYADTAGRQASIAYPGGSSANPAGDAARPRQRAEVTLTGIGAAVWFGLPALGFVIAAAMLTNLIAAAFGGILVPLALERFRIDPAVSSGAFVTTVTDIVGYFSFLSFATLYFGLK
mgnify:CR=1 FL=1